MGLDAHSSRCVGLDAHVWAPQKGPTSLEMELVDFLHFPVKMELVNFRGEIDGQHTEKVEHVPRIYMHCISGAHRARALFVLKLRSANLFFADLNNLRNTHTHFSWTLLI